MTISSVSNKAAFFQSAKKPITSLPSPLFGTDGIRGKVGELLNAPLAFLIGFSAGQVLKIHYLKNKPVIIGQDSRNSSDMLGMALSAGLTTAGLDVWYLGLCSTPAVAYLTSTLDAIAGVAISASHNPPEDNGIKFFGSDGTKLSEGLERQIEVFLRTEKSSVTSDYRPWGRHYYQPELLNRYLESLQAPFSFQTNLVGMRVVLDLAWGAAVNLAPTAFRAMGAEVICLHDKADGDRINVKCGSTHLAPLQAAVQEYQADLGFAFDGDADRVIAVDEEGGIVDGDCILYLWGKKLLKEQKLPGKTIIATVMSNLGFEMAWRDLGGKLIRTAVGDRHVSDEMIRFGAMLGGEQSGHILCRHYGVSGDGLQTALHLAALVKKTGTSLLQLHNNSFQTYPQLLKNVRVEDRERRLNWKDCAALQKAIQTAEKDLGESGRVLIRASGTEPVIRVMVEAANAQVTSYWSENLALAVQKYLVV
jgi:phosphoglucosamine mutase